MSMSFTIPLRLNREDAPRHAPSVPTPVVFERAQRPCWEYHVVRIDPREDEPLDEATLAALGAEGWLLAGLLEPHTGRPSLYYYFVRATE